MSAHPKRRGLVTAVVVAALALVTGPAAAAVLWPDGSTRGNAAYGVISCRAPALPGATVNVQVTDSGDMMMSQAPIRAALVAIPTTVPAGRVSFVVANTGALVHELVILPLPAG